MKWKISSHWPLCDPFVTILDWMIEDGQDLFENPKIKYDGEIIFEDFITKTSENYFCIWLTSLKCFETNSENYKDTNGIVIIYGEKTIQNVKQNKMKLFTWNEYSKKKNWKSFWSIHDFTLENQGKVKNDANINNDTNAKVNIEEDGKEPMIKKGKIDENYSVINDNSKIASQSDDIVVISNNNNGNKNGNNENIAPLARWFEFDWIKCKQDIIELKTKKSLTILEIGKDHQLKEASWWIKNFLWHSKSTFFLCREKLLEQYPNEWNQYIAEEKIFVSKEKSILKSLMKFIKKNFRFDIIRICDCDSMKKTWMLLTLVDLLLKEDGYIIFSCDLSFDSKDEQKDIISIVQNFEKAFYPNYKMEKLERPIILRRIKQQ